MLKNFGTKPDLNVVHVEYMGQGKSGFHAYLAERWMTNERDHV